MRRPSLITFPNNLKNKTALVRVDFNEPLVRGSLADSYRIRESIPTIREVRRRGARVVLLAHLENPVTKKQLSTRVLVRPVSQLLGESIGFCREYSQSAVRRALMRNPIVLLENVRFQKGETENDAAFARLLAALGDLYINEAFSVSHRKHASIVGVPKYLPSYAGLLLRREANVLGSALEPPHPFLLIVGGAKFETKFTLLKNFLPKADGIFIGGALANAFLVAEDVPIGASLYEKDVLPLIKKHFLSSQKIMLPFDVRTAHATSKSVFDVGEREQIRDIGRETAQRLLEVARDSRFVLWNGPLGYIEKGFTEGTVQLLKGLARLPRTKVVLGGGDTLAVLGKLRLQKKFYHVSTGGGALLDFLAVGTLPGIEALRGQKRTKK